MRNRQHPLYSTWGNMRTRCNTATAPNYKYYGGRGIKVCERWDNFELFVEDMGAKPSPAHSIDRIDNDKGYSPENCRWATKQEQMINRGKQSNNTSGFTGVAWDKSRKKWLAYSKRNRKFINLGRFNTFAEAVLAKQQWYKEKINENQ